MKKNGILPARLKEIMTTLGLKQYEFAVRIGVTESTVSDWVSGKTEPKYTQIQKIVTAFNLNPQVLFDWK